MPDLLVPILVVYQRDWGHAVVYLTFCGHKMSVQDSLLALRASAWKIPEITWIASAENT